MGSSTEDDLDDFREEISGIREDITGIGHKIAEHEVRFGNGREVMAELKADIDKLKPKAPDWLKLVGAGAAVLGATLGAHYWLIEQFNDRPTGVQIEKAFHEHSEVGHAATQRDINTIRETQTEQRVLLDGLRATVSGQGQKLDMILERLPDRRDR